MYKRLSKATLWLLGILTIVFAYLGSQLGFDYNFENFFPQDDPQTEFYNDFRYHFQSDNDWVVVALVNEEGIFEQEFLQRVDSLTDELKKIRHVKDVQSPTQMVEPLRDPLIGTIFKKPLIRIDDPSKYATDSARIFSRPELIGTFFSENGKSLAINISHTQFLSKKASDTLATALSKVVDPVPFDKSLVVGRVLGQQYYVGMMQTELLVFVSLSILLIIIFLIIAFRSFWGVWVPITVVLLSVVWILGIMKLTGKPIDLMLTILPTIIFVVGMSDVVHILSRYFEELRNGHPKMEAIKIAFKEVGLATFLTSLTTAIGFLTLLTSSIAPIQDFGIYTAIGVFVAFTLAFTLLPSVLVLSKVPKAAIKKRSGFFWTRQLSQAFRWTIRNQRLMLITGGILIAISIYGISKIEVNNFILEDLKDDNPLKKEFAFMENKYSGARPFEMAILYDDTITDPWQREILVDIDSLDQYLLEEYGVGTLISPAVIVKTAYRSMKGGNKEYYKIPESQEEIDRLIRNIEKFDREGMLELYVDAEEKGWARVNGKVGDLGSIVFFEKNKKLRDYFENEVDTEYFDIKITGTATLIDSNNRSLANEMIIGLLIAFAVIALVVGLMFKSLRMIIIALIPNMIPLLLIAGILGYFGIYLKVSTAIIFTIAFGIAVDDTIHFMSKLRLQLGKGRSLIYALKRTYLSTGKAIIVTSIILCGGFFTLIISDFLGTFYVGLLISLTLLFAVLADLFLLPVLLLLFYKDSRNLAPTSEEEEKSKSDHKAATL
ncbi:efflux RND transporter permease subunit [Halocola ammonii]